MVQIQEIHNQKPMEVAKDLHFDTDHFAQSELVANNIGKRKIRDFLVTWEKRRRLLCSNINTNANTCDKKEEIQQTNEDKTIGDAVNNNKNNK